MGEGGRGCLRPERSRDRFKGTACHKNRKKYETKDGRQSDRGRETGDRRGEIGEGRQEKGDRRCETGNGRWESGDRRGQDM